MIVTVLWILLLKKFSLSKYRTVLKVLFWLALMVSYTAALIPQDLAAHISTWSDKTQHILAFVAMAFLLRLGYGTAYVWVFVWLVGFGGLIEVSQYYTPDRFADYHDVLADMIGIGLGLVLSRAFARFF